MIKKAIFRFRQFGGWRMLRAYTKVGVLPTMLKEVVRVTVQRNPLKEAYPAVMGKIVPMLQIQYRPLVKQLVEKYADTKLEHEKNDVVWFCWMQGIEQAPELVKVCLASLKKHVRGKRFVIITAENYKDYVTFPEHVESLRKKGWLPDSHFTDLIRLELLIKYGGTWIDSTVLCTADGYPDKMMDCDLFLFQYRRTKEDGFEGISSWFISAYSNNQLLMILRDMLFQYWRDYDCLMDYYVFHLFFGMIAEWFPEKIEAMPKANSMRAIQMAYYMEQAYDARVMNQFLSMSCFHKLDYRKSRLMTKGKRPTFYSHIIENYT